MTLIEHGKYYRDRAGRKVGPMTGTRLRWVIGHARAEDPEWEDNGKAVSPLNSDMDLIAIWEDGPVRTVTRTEIVPGIYGKLNVTGTYQKSRVTLDWVTDNFHTAPPIVGLDASELRAAAATLTEIADALDAP